MFVFLFFLQHVAVGAAQGMFKKKVGGKKKKGSTFYMCRERKTTARIWTYPYTKIKQGGIFLKNFTVLDNLLPLRIQRCPSLEFMAELIFFLYFLFFVWFLFFVLFYIFCLILYKSNYRIWSVIVSEKSYRSKTFSPSLFFHFEKKNRSGKGEKRTRK